MATFDPKTLNFRNPAAPNLPLAPELYGRQYQDQFSNVLRLYFNQLDNAFASLLSPDGGKYLKFPYGAFHQDGTTTLSSSITNVSTTPISVASTTGFPSSGWILIGSEIIQYTSTTATTFAGTITRGALGTTGSSHAVSANVTEVQGTGSPTTIGTVLFNNTDLSNSIYTSADFSKIYLTYPGIYNFQYTGQVFSSSASAKNIFLWIRRNGTNIGYSTRAETLTTNSGFTGINFSFTDSCTSR